MEYDDTCPCCLVKIKPIKAFNLKCGHRFHIACLKEWVKSTSGATCPMCRAEIIRDDAEPGSTFAVKATEDCLIDWNFKSDEALHTLYRYVLEHFDEISSRYETKQNDKSGETQVIDTGKMRWTIPINPDLKIRSELTNLLQGANAFISTFNP